jgi:hypothetical protein
MYQFKMGLPKRQPPFSHALRRAGLLSVLGSPQLPKRKRKGEDETYTLYSKTTAWKITTREDLPRVSGERRARSQMPDPPHRPDLCK